MFDLDVILKKLPADNKVAAAFYNLENKGGFYLHADESFHAASTFKVAVMLEVYHQVSQGRFNLDDRLPLKNSFISLADGSSFAVDEKDDDEFTLYQRIGETESIRELTRLMIVRSSNFAANILIEKVAAKRVNDFMKELGIEGVSILRGVEDNKAFQLGLNNSVTARGLMQMMKAICEEKVVSQNASHEMVQILLGQEFNEGIPAGLPETVKAAHKTGSIKGIYHDIAIVFPTNCKPYILTILTRGFENEKDASTCVAEISALVYKQRL